VHFRKKFITSDFFFFILRGGMLADTNTFGISVAEVANLEVPEENLKQDTRQLVIAYLADNGGNMLAST
jgi:hypothetical protein